MMCLLRINARSITGLCCVNDLNSTNAASRSHFSFISPRTPQPELGGRISHDWAQLNIAWPLSLSVRYRSDYRQLRALGESAACWAWGCAVAEALLCFCTEITLSLLVTARR